MTQKRALVIRHGAYGDMIIISPVIKRLKALGYYVILYTGKRGRSTYSALLSKCCSAVARETKSDDGKDLYECSDCKGKAKSCDRVNDPRVDEIILHDESVPKEKFLEHIAEQKKKIKHDWFCNFTGSIEQNLALHPTQPEYIYTKKEKAEKCNKNYYEETERWSGLQECDRTPSLTWLPQEEENALKRLKQGKINVLWALSGSGANKVYPWAEYVMLEVIKNRPDVHFITVGDERCQILGNIDNSISTDNLTELAGVISMRESCALTKYVDLVVSPDTGVLHASGCYETPKIGLLGHTTKENITKHFINDNSLESRVPCSPCFFLIYDHSIQCPVDVVSHSAWCMSIGLDGETVYNKIMEVLPCLTPQQ